MTILGIGPGLADTGYGLIKKNGPTINHLSHGVIKTSARLPHVVRLESIHRQVKKIIRAYKPDLIAVEELFFYKNAKTAFKVGEGRGVVMLTAVMEKVPVTELTPLQVKQAVTGYGWAEKTQIQKMLKIILKLKEPPAPDDAADALAIAYAASNQSV